MGSSERAKRKKSNVLGEESDAHKGEGFECEKISEIEGDDGIEPVKELFLIEENCTEVCVDGEKRKVKKRKNRKEKNELCTSFENNDCIERNSHEVNRMDGVEEKISGDSVGTACTVSAASNDPQKVLPEFNGLERSFYRSGDAHTELCLKVKRRKSKKKNGKEKIEFCNSLENKDILPKENGDLCSGRSCNDSIQATNIVPEAKNDGKKGVFSESKVHGNLVVSWKENRTQVCLEVYKRKKSKGKRDLAASEESKHSVHNMLEGNGDVAEGASVQTTKNVLVEKTDVQECMPPELQEQKCIGTTSKIMKSNKNVCLKIYERKSKKKNGKRRIELSNSLTSKHVEQNLPEEHGDMSMEKFSDECTKDTRIVQEATNASQEESFPKLQLHVEKNVGMSLSKVIDVAGCSHSHSAQNKDFEGASSNLCASIERAPPAIVRKKLLVLDLNGLLVDIVSFVPRGYRSDTRISRKDLFKRPFCDDFLKFCFEKFNIGVWSSRFKWNVDRVVDYVMGDRKNELLFCWDQSHCTNTGAMTIENSRKPLMLKELQKLWDKHDPDLPWELGEYNQSNTLLLDDSPYKALRNPPHTAIFPAPYSFSVQNDNSLGSEGDLRVYLEGVAMADDVQKYVEQHPFGQRPISSKNPSWDFYLKILQEEH
ncbi:hypothetical protein Scep_014209 [Stephania cephalantha]|uniref:FCP1 homology domain-containing protein n=1 Tax=Stephania cephalantha TaxID=152367 RepID=A0AAP0P050_9MAGN